MNTPIEGVIPSIPQVISTANDVIEMKITNALLLDLFIYLQAAWTDPNHTIDMNKSEQVSQFEKLIVPITTERWGIYHITKHTVSVFRL